MSRLFARRQKTKKATTLVSKQTIEKALDEARSLVNNLTESHSNDERIDKLQESIGFLESVINKSPLEMQQEGASTLDDYFDDAVMPDMAHKIKHNVDMIAKFTNEESVGAHGELPSDSWEEYNTRANEWDKQTLKDRPKPKGKIMASGSDNWVNDRDENGEPKAPEQVEVPRVAAGKKAGDVVPMPKKNPPAPAAPPAPKVSEPSADITQLSSDTLAKMQKALAGSEDLMNDKAAQAFIAAIAEELMNRPVEVEQPEQPEAAPAKAASAKTATIEHKPGHRNSKGELAPWCNVKDGKVLDSHKTREEALKALRAHEYFKGASLGGLNIAASEDDGVTASVKMGKTPPGISEELMHKLKKEYPGDENKAYATAWKIHNEKKAAITLLNAVAKAASGNAGSWFVHNEETASLLEDGGRTPELGEAHGKLEDNTHIDLPDTTLPSKFAAGDITTGKAVKLVEKLGDELKSLYFEAKPITQVLDSRPVREAVEAIYRAYDLIGEASKVLSKQKIQEDLEAQATEIKSKKKSSSLLFGLTIAADEDGGIGEDFRTGLARYPEFKPLVDEVSRQTLHTINEKAPSIESKMPYKAQFVLEEVIRQLEKSV